MHVKAESKTLAPEEIAKALVLARAVKEEAAGGEQEPNYLIWQLAAAVEQLAQALVEANVRSAE